MNYIDAGASMPSWYLCGKWNIREYSMKISYKEYIDLRKQIEEQTIDDEVLLCEFFYNPKTGIVKIKDKIKINQL